jgi:hypothetical protein
MMSNEASRREVLIGGESGGASCGTAALHITPDQGAVCGLLLCGLVVEQRTWEEALLANNTSTVSFIAKTVERQHCNRK